MHLEAIDESKDKLIFHSDYEILSRLGAGGFGVVYKARQLSTDQLVAVKVMTADQRSSEQSVRTARFARETRISAQLHHPNIVPLIGSGTTPDGRPYNIFSYIPGLDLAELLRDEGPPRVDETKHFMLQILDALALAHAHGIVHRDLKPSNVRISSADVRRNAFVLDFGIGGILDENPEPKLTQSGDTLGTPGYGAPEQWRGEAPSPRSDLFSWALLLIECLTGRPVYVGSPGDVLYRQMSPEPIVLPSMLAGSSIAPLLQKALEKDVAKREVTAKGLFFELDRLDVSQLDDPRLDPASTQVASLQSSERNIRDKRHVALAVCEIRSNSSQDGDSEEMFHDAFRRVAAAARDHGGTVLTALGGTVALCWGYPTAQETDPRNASRGVLAAAHSLSDYPGLHIGVGVHHGPLTSIGLPPTLGATAQRAQGLASEAHHKEVLSSAEFARVAADFIACELADGRTSGARVSRILAERSKPEPTRTAGICVGRDSELKLCLERWDRAGNGSGQCCLITGEPGIGKSRLVAELHETLGRQAKPHAFVEIKCAPETRHAVLSPVIEAISTLFDMDRSREPSERVGLVVSGLGTLGLDADELAPLLLPFLSLPLGERRALDVSPQRRRDLLLAALVRVLGAAAERSPSLVLLEDLHWADETTLELTSKLIEEVGSWPMMLLMTARPDFVAPFSTMGMLQLHLNRLERNDVSSVMVALAGGKQLPAPLVDQVMSRTDGVPLFVEELMSELLDGGYLAEEEGAFRLVREPSGDAIPATLQALLTARLDKLGDALTTAQLASALGRESAEEVLFAVSDQGAAVTAEHVSSLLRAGVMMRRRRGASRLLAFKHALVRDAAYSSLPVRDREKIHARIAEVLEEQFPELVQTRPDLLALHHAEANQKPRAVEYATKAAQTALDRSAYAETIAHAKRLLDWAPAADDSKRTTIELTANGLLTQAMMSHRGWADPEVRASVERSGALLRELESGSELRVPNLWALFTYHHVASNRAEARRCAREAVELAEAAKDPGLESAALTLLGITLHADGSSNEAISALERAIDLYDPKLHSEHARNFGLDSLVLAKTLLAHFRWHHGDAELGFQLIAEALAWARELRHIPSLAIGLLYGSHVYQFAGDKPTVARMTGEILGLAGQFGLPAFQGYAAILHGWATGDESATGQILDMIGFLGCRTFLSYYSALRADAIAANDPARALQIVDECLAHCETNREYLYQPQLLLEKAALVPEVERPSALYTAREAARRYGQPRTELAALRALIQSGEMPDEAELGAARFSKLTR